MSRLLTIIGLALAGCIHRAETVEDNYSSLSNIREEEEKPKEYSILKRGGHPVRADIEDKSIVYIGDEAGPGYCLVVFDKNTFYGTYCSLDTNNNLDAYSKNLFNPDESKPRVVFLRRDYPNPGFWYDKDLFFDLVRSMFLESKSDDLFYDEAAERVGRGAVY